MKQHKTKILMFGWEFPPHHNGGLGVACEGLSNALLNLDSEVIFVLPRAVKIENPSMRFVFANEGGFVYSINSMLQPYMTPTQYEEMRKYIKDDSFGTTLIDEVNRYALAARRIAKENDFDVIHAHDWLSFQAGLVAKEVSGKPLVVHVHITSIEQSGKSGVDERIYGIEQNAFQQADAVVVVSNHTRDIVLDNYRVDANKVHVIHNGIDAQKYESTSTDDVIELKKQGKQIVLYAGRLSMHKGPDYFIQTAKEVSRFCPDARFVISGTGELEWQLVRQAASLGISDKVFFAGFNNKEDLKRLYRSADIYVLPSVTEPFGLTPLESLINGTPVLISKQSGVSEVIRNALTVDFWDVNEMTNKIVSVLNNAPLGNQLGKYGREEVRAITWTETAKKCIALYNNLLAVA